MVCLIFRLGQPTPGPDPGPVHDPNVVNWMDLLAPPNVEIPEITVTGTPSQGPGPVPGPDPGPGPGPFPDPNPDISSIYPTMTDDYDGDDPRTRIAHWLMLQQHYGRI
jgi:hypothetical protein